MNRQELLDFLVKAQRLHKERNLRPFDLDRSDDLMIVYPTDEALLIPTIGADGRQQTLLILVSEETRKTFEEIYADQGWPWFENELRDALKA